MYGPSDDYRNHVFILTEVYQLPSARERNGRGYRRLANLLIGGWSLNSATNFSSGLPFNYGINSCNAEIDNGPCRPSRSGGVKDESGQDSYGRRYWFRRHYRTRACLKRHRCSWSGFASAAHP